MVRAASERSAMSSLQVLHTFGDTLTFSEEEWLSLTTWQKELYRTVMRDTAELFHSLGFMCQLKDDQVLSDSWAPRSAEGSVWPPDGVVIEEISGENFIIQISEVSAAPEDRALPSLSPLTDSAWIPRAEPDNQSEVAMLVTPVGPGAGSGDIGASASLGGPGATRSRGTNTFIPSVTIKTEDTFEQPACHPATGSTTPATGSTTPASESGFLTVIQVKDINVGPVGEPGPVQAELWDVHVAPQDPPAVFPVALMVSHNTSNVMAGPGPVLVSPAQWSQQDDGRGQWTMVEGPVSHPGSPEQPKCEPPVITKRYALRSREARGPAPEEPPQPPKLFSCMECGRTFSYLFQFNRHQKIHARDKLLLRPVAPPPKKVYKIPHFLPARSPEEATKVEAGGDACQKLHQNLQLSTLFLQNLLTSTCGFQYD